MMSKMYSYNYRKIAFENHGEKCVLCGADENIQVHHIDGDHANSDPENLMPVCNSCHGKIHADNGLYTEYKPDETMTYEDYTKVDVPDKVVEEWGVEDNGGVDVAFFMDNGTLIVKKASEVEL